MKLKITHDKEKTCSKISLNYKIFGVKKTDMVLASSGKKVWNFFLLNKLYSPLMSNWLFSRKIHVSPPHFQKHGSSAHRPRKDGILGSCIMHPEEFCMKFSACFGFQCFDKIKITNWGTFHKLFLGSMENWTLYQVSWFPLFYGQ